jgi:hypothetical protein
MAENQSDSSGKKEQIKFLIIECSCLNSFVVSNKQLKDFPQETYECPGSYYFKDGKPLCDRKYTTVELEKNFHKGTYYPEP